MIAIAHAVSGAPVRVEAHMTVLAADHLSLCLTSFVESLNPRDSTEGIERVIGAAPGALRPLTEEILKAAEGLPGAPVRDRWTYIVTLGTEISAPEP